MGGAVGEQEPIPSPKDEQISLKIYFEKWATVLMDVGMTYKQFWCQDVLIAKAYISLFKYRQEKEQQRLNDLAYLTAIYMYDVMLDLHPFRKEASKGYPERKPLTPEEVEKYKKDKVAREQEIFKARMQEMTSRINANFDNKEE